MPVLRFALLSLLHAGILVAISMPPPAEAQAARIASSPDLVMTNAASRDGIDLSGSWTYSIDPYRDGLQGFHGSPAGMGHQRFDPRDVSEATLEDPSALYEYDMRRSERVTLPGAWMVHAPGLRHYDGLVWYDRAIAITPEPDKRYFLHFGAANYRTRAYVNGTLVGTHEGGFTSFTFEATDALIAGENRITIGVDSERSPRTVPPTVTDWETYGGVTRPIRLVETPSTFVAEAWIRLKADTEIAATVQLDGPQAANRRVTVSIPELNYTLTGRTNEDGTLAISGPSPADLERWSPDSPKLYTVNVSAGQDRLAERIGFRTVEVDGDRILLNGAPIFLRGISMHEEELGNSPSRHMTRAAARALLTEIKDGLNGNFVRLAHYPHSETTLRLADEMGLLVWSEIPVYWLIDWDNEDTLATARRMLAENVHRDRNRASVILWSVANETPVSDDRNSFLNTLIGDVRSLDDSRLVTAALLTDLSEEDGHLTARINDPLANRLDVMAVNTYNGWYGPVPLQDVHAINWPDTHGKPLIFSEFGAGALAGFHDPVHMRKFSEEYQAEYYAQTLAMSDRISFLSGMSPWILKDFRSPRRQHPVYQQGWNRKGLISETGVRKKAFGVLRDYYAEKQRQGIDAPPAEQPDQ